MTLKKLLIAAFLLSPFGFTAESVKAQNLENYKFLGAGVCPDVKLPCVVLVEKKTDFYYAVFNRNGTKLVAITKVSPDGEEVVIWGKLPPASKQPRQPEPEREGTNI